MIVSWYKLMIKSWVEIYKMKVNFCTLRGERMSLDLQLYRPVSLLFSPPYPLISYNVLFALSFLMLL